MESLTFREILSFTIVIGTIGTRGKRLPDASKHQLLSKFTNWVSETINELHLWKFEKWLKSRAKNIAL